MTQLMLAANEGDDVRVVELIQKGAIVNETTELGANALYFAVYRNHYDTAELLLSHGADPNLRPENVATMIAGPARNRDKAFLSLLLASIDENNLGYRTVLKVFVENCELEALDTLLYSMKEKASWGILIAESHFDMNSDCAAELVVLVKKYK